MKNASEKRIMERSISGGTWLAASYIGQKLIGTVSFLILARLLTPADFGAMAVILIVPKFIGSLSETGFTTAIVQKKGDVRAYLDPVWTFGLIKSLLIFLIVFTLGHWIAIFLNAEPMLNAIRLGGFFIILQNLANVGEVFFFKELDFKKLFFRNMAKETVYVVIALLSVFFFTKSYVALFVATVASYLTHTIMSYLLHPYRPRLSFQFRELIDLTHYSRWIVLQRWCQQLYNLLENAGVARLTGITAMGYFSKAKSLASVAPGFLGSILNPISFSTYSKLQNDSVRIHAGILQTFNIIAFLLIPTAFLILVAGGKLIIIAVGDTWLPMVTAFRILFFFYVANVTNDVIVNITNAVGKPRAQATIALVRLVITGSLLLLLTQRFGIEGAAISLLIGMGLTLVVNCIHLSRVISLPLLSMAKTALVPFLVSIVLLIPTWLWKETLLQWKAYMFLFVVASAGIIYCASVAIITKKTPYGHYQTLFKVYKNLKNI